MEQASYLIAMWDSILQSHSPTSNLSKAMWKWWLGLNTVHGGGELVHPHNTVYLANIITTMINDCNGDESTVDMLRAAEKERSKLSVVVLKLLHKDNQDRVNTIVPLM
jgi:hypothetical protein